MSTNQHTPTNVAEWMVADLEAHGVLEQHYAVYEIEKQFGAEFVYLNDGGNPAIDRKVLKEFKRLRSADVEWESGERRWVK